MNVYTLEFVVTDPKTGAVSLFTLEVIAPNDATMNRVWTNLTNVIDPDLELGGGVVAIRSLRDVATNES